MADGTTDKNRKEVQGLVCRFIYVCFFHRISLVVIHARGNIEEIKEYFDIISSLYQFFKKSAVLNMYEGTQRD